MDKVCEIVRKQLALPADSAVTGESKFAALGADSLDTVSYFSYELSMCLACFISVVILIVLITDKLAKLIAYRLRL